MKYKELNIGDWFKRPDAAGNAREFIFIRTADTCHKLSTRDFIIYPYQYAGDYYLSPDPEQEVIFISQLPVEKWYYKQYTQQPSGAVQLFGKGTQFFFDPHPGEASLILIYGIDGIGIICSGRYAGKQIDFTQIKLIETYGVTLTTSILNCWEGHL